MSADHQETAPREVPTDVRSALRHGHPPERVVLLEGLALRAALEVHDHAVSLLPLDPDAPWSSVAEARERAQDASDALAARLRDYVAARLRAFRRDNLSESPTPHKVFDREGERWFADAIARACAEVGELDWLRLLDAGRDLRGAPARAIAGSIWRGRRRMV